MRKVWALIAVVLVTVFVATPSAHAVTLLGFPFFVFQNVTTGAGNIYIYDATGGLCGIATVTGLDTVSSGRLAWETARDIIVTGPPLNGGTWNTAFAGGPCAGPPSPLQPITSISSA